ncbi:MULTISPECIES: glutathione S-transferase C-terminal domain-containing protein [unclassified Ensifer]|uniref:glutathione S-transferase C-terminal domain-containing protein n=1 Tax=unclassified Ensifer TaxID=2633371 RepID=UPI000B336CD5|nr:MULTISPECIES: glutathione S-transferase C-terminal domain-containing protein [unclassified Ensifer]
MGVKLFYAPGACSLASHICLIEGNMQFEAERVDLKTKITASGDDFRAVTAKGYVPALMLDSGEVVTENVAVLAYLAGELPALDVSGELGRTRLIEVLAYLSTEIHKSFESLFLGANTKEHAKTSASITYRLQYLADHMRDEYLFGDHPSVADFYLFVMMSWAKIFGVEIPAPLLALDRRLLARPSVQAALRSEGLAT